MTKVVSELAWDLKRKAVAYLLRRGATTPRPFGPPAQTSPPFLGEIHQMPTRPRSSGLSSARTAVITRAASSCVKPLNSSA